MKSSLPHVPKSKNKPQHHKLTDAEKFARRVARKCEVLAPQLPHIDRHDLELIVAEQLKTPEERMRVMFLQQHDEGLISFHAALLAKLAKALAHAELDALMLDNSSAIEFGTATPKKRIDLLVKSHKGLQAKLRRFERAFGVAQPRPSIPLSQAVLAVGRTVSIEFAIAHSSRRSFNSLKARAKRILIGAHELPIAAREDIGAAETVTHQL